MMVLPGRERSLTKSSAVSIHECDVQTETGQQKRPRFCIASRGENNSHMLKWRSFKCIFVTVLMSVDHQ